MNFALCPLFPDILVPDGPLQLLKIQDSFLLEILCNTHELVSLGPSHLYVDQDACCPISRIHGTYLLSNVDSGPDIYTYFGLF